MKLGSGTPRWRDIPFGHGRIFTSPYIEHPEHLPRLKLLQDGDAVLITVATREQPLSSCLKCHILGDFTFLGERPCLTRGPACRHRCRLCDKHVRQELGFMWAVH